ncbi:hypothetical protein HK100_003321 [Physocladia obscura]|uniref:Tryptophan synthase beta chain-like PALP domain-containing protein n=1 Tax=Physocladia obscura TaxID=109957 RepID=A0AAD5T7L5_9FUNG|nr:hypothetical protein HK100_003321 [Physocladia obscura]
MNGSTLIIATAASVAIAAGLTAFFRVRPTKSILQQQRQSQHPVPDLSQLHATPLIVIPSLSSATGCTIIAKCEMLSAGGSSKDRLARAVITDAETRGLLIPHESHYLVEGTVGSTGISLATMALARGYRALIVMPDDQAREKYELLAQLGAIVEKVRPCSIADANHFVRVAERRAKEINEAGELNANGTPIKAFFVNQFETPVNFETHYTQTGPEIVEQLKSHGFEILDSFVMGAGTGGTLAGVSLCLKQAFGENLRVILADPEGSGLFHKVKHNIMYSPHEAEGTRKRHQVDTIVEGIGINRLTSNFSQAIKLNLITDALKVTDKEALEMSRYIMRNDGIFCGSSTAVHLVAAVREARRLGPGKTILTFLCDSGVRHLTKFWNNEYVTNAGFKIEGYGTHKSRPTTESLRQHLRTLITQSADAEIDGNSALTKISSFLQRVTAPPLPTFKTKDLIVVIVALTADSRGFLGVFNLWFQVPVEWISPLVSGNFAASGMGTGSGSESIDPEDEGEALFEAAIKRKAARDYADSARLFTRAAQSYASGTTVHSQLEAAKAHGEAAKCYTVLKQAEYAKNANDTAASIYAHHDAHHTRAAAIYEKIAQELKMGGNLVDALAYLDKAVALYRTSGDARTYHVNAQRVELLAMLGRYSDAIILYEALSAHAITIATLKFSVRGFLTDALFCMLAQQDQQGIKNALQRYLDQYTLFADVEPVWRMLLHAWECSNAEVFEATEARFRLFNNVTKGAWQDRAIGRVKEALSDLN